ncbi:MAG: hypothetical protein K2Z80_14535 [Xanthobacteraceae bacterium]|nr:hypothetical protein [Xanthobacteraceae bacterium]
MAAYYEDIIGLVPSHRERDRAVFATRQGLECLVLERGQRPALEALSFEISTAPHEERVCPYLFHHPERARSLGAKNFRRAAPKNNALSASYSHRSPLSRKRYSLRHIQKGLRRSGSSDIARVNHHADGNPLSHGEPEGVRR